MVAPVYGPRHFNYSYYLCRAPDIVEVGTIFNVFSYDAVLSRDSNPLPSRGRANALCVEPRSREKREIKKYLFYSRNSIKLNIHLLKFMNQFSKLENSLYLLEAKLFCS